MEKYFIVNFKAQLGKFVLAFKAADSSIDIYWKKGQKIAQSSKMPLINTIVNFDQTLEINCNMVFDGQSKVFKQKMTKFEIVLHTQKGDKKVGEIRFDVSGYLNERNKAAKEYELPLQKCPDKNARLILKLTAKIMQEISKDTISNSSSNTVSIETLINNGPISTITKSNIIVSSSSVSSENVANKDVSSKSSKSNKSIRSESTTNEAPFVSTTSIEQGVVKSKEEPTRDFQAQNKKIREKLKKKGQLMKQNQELKVKIKNEEYESVKLLKEKIEAGKKQFQKLQIGIKKQILLQKEVLAMEDEIFRCKLQIMNAFNYANEKGGGKLMNELQQACGLRQL